MSVSRINVRRKMTETEKDSDDWFRLEQMLSNLILKDIREEWNEGNIPSVVRKIFEINNIVLNSIRESFWCLKERGEIYILPNQENNDGIILEKEFLEKLGFDFDKDQKGI